MAARSRKPTAEHATAIEPVSRGSMVRVKVGGRTYDAVYVGNCRTCTHPARMWIEEKIIQNFAYRAIAELYSEREIEIDGATEMMPAVSYSSIRNHFQQGHMPLETATLRRLAERRAQQIGSTYEEQAGQFVDHVSLAEAVVTKAYSGLVQGSLVPEIKDGLAAAKLLQDVQSAQQGGLDSEAWSQAMTIYFETAHRIMPPALWAEFTQALTGNPILRALQRRMDPNHHEDDDVLDAELVDAPEGR